MIKTIIVGCVASGITLLLTKIKKKEVKNIEEDLAYEWNDIFEYSRKYKDHFYLCPKCRTLHPATNKKQKNFDPNTCSKLCFCMEYPKEHFHFSCCDCEFKTIFKTADDK